MKKKILCTMMSMVMVASLFAGCGTDSGKENSASDTSKTKEAGTTISVAAIETAYGSEMWQKVADAFTEETGTFIDKTSVMSVIICPLINCSVNAASRPVAR